MAQSNGSRAVQFAAAHLADTEAQLEEARAKIIELQTNIGYAQGRITEQELLIRQLEGEKSMWFSRAMSMAQALVDASAVLLQGGKQASAIVREVENAGTSRIENESDSDRSSPPRLPQVGDREIMDLQRP